MKVMNTRNIINVTRWDLATHKKDYMNGWLAFAGFAILTGLIWGITNEMNYAQELGKFWGAGLTIIWSVMITGISNTMHTKTQRIAALTLPASMNEKLVSRMLTYLVIYPLGLIVCLLAGDVIQYLLNLILKGSEGAHFASPYFIGYLVSPMFSAGYFSINFGNLTFVSTLTNLMVLVFFLSYAFLCGCMWTKHAFLKGIGTFTLGMILLATLMAFIGYLITGETNWEISEESVEALHKTICIIFSIICLSLSAFFIWLGYRKFVNRQVIDNKSRWYGF